MADNQNPTRDELEAMDETELQALAKQRGITVKASEGEDEPSHEDYVNALVKSPTPSQTQGLPQGKAAFDTTIRGGRYQNAQGKFVNAHGQEIDEEGNVLDDSETPQPPVAE